MDNTEETSSKNNIRPFFDRTSRSFTDRLPMGPFAAASRFMSCLSKQPYNAITKRDFALPTDKNEKASIVKPGSKRTLSEGNRPPSPRSPLPMQSIYHTNSPLTVRSSITTPSNLCKIVARTTRCDTSEFKYDFDSVYKELYELADTNCKYFSQQTTDVCRRFENLLAQLLHSISFSLPLVRYLIDNFHYFDYSSEIQANGYRTLVLAHGRLGARTLEILRQVDTKRVSLLFNLMYSSRLFQELESWTRAFVSMQHIICLAAKLVDYSEKKVLYIDGDRLPHDIELAYFKIVAFDSEYFLGRTCGFQFAPSVGKMLTFLLAGLATYHETYNRSISCAAASLATAPKYILFPEQRAKKCAAIFRDGDYLFCKSFWNIVDHDYVKIGSRYVVPSVTVSKYFQIGPEPIELNSIIIQAPAANVDINESNEYITSSCMSANSNSKQSRQFVNIKLLSHEIRDGMNELALKKSDLEISSTKILPMSDHLLIHIHGGGFIATSSTTHEVYLKPWALGLEIPIVSIDYSLAPEHPFPYAIEECFYAYAWILMNANKLGWTGKRLLLVGDSAGGNLVTTVTMKAIEVGIRKPDAILCFYSPFRLGYSMSPSRLMAIMDPLLNSAFLWGCVAAYAGIKFDDKIPHHELETTVVPNQNHSSFERRKKTDNTTLLPGHIILKSDSSLTTSSNFKCPESSRGDTYYSQLCDIMGPRQANLLRQLRKSTLSNNPYMSPLLASDDLLRQFPTTYLIACDQDPLMDDSIIFARHLCKLSVEHHLTVVHNLTHGFLNFYNANNECKKPCGRDSFIDDNIEFARRLRDLNVPHCVIVADEWPHGFLNFAFASTDIALYNNEVIKMLQSILQQTSLNPDTIASIPSRID